MQLFNVNIKGDNERALVVIKQEILHKHAIELNNR